jgi:hypothetical protein
MIERDQLAALQSENARLIAMLEWHGIDWRVPPEPEPEPVPGQDQCGGIVPGSLIGWQEYCKR